MFHCLVIKVLCLSVSQTARLLYHIHLSLSSTFFKFFRSFFDVCASLSGDSFTLSHPHRIVNNFFAFFKTFQIVCSEETILRDSSVRITLSNRAVNTFLNFFTKTSTCINKRYHRPFRIHGTFINHLLIQKCKILFCRFFCCCIICCFCHSE